MAETPQVRFVEQTADRVVAERVGHPQGGHLLSGLLVLLLLSSFVYCALRRRWVGLAAVLVAAVVVLFGRPGTKDTRLILEPAKSMITWQDYRDGRVLSSHSASASEFRVADLDRSSAGQRLTLWRWSGGQEFPLGELYLPDNPNAPAEKTLLDDLNNMLSRARSHAKDSLNAMP